MHSCARRPVNQDCAWKKSPSACFSSALTTPDPGKSIIELKQARLLRAPRMRSHPAGAVARSAIWSPEGCCSSPSIDDLLHETPRRHGLQCFKL
jgi:hypothetical protein